MAYRTLALWLATCAPLAQGGLRLTPPPAAGLLAPHRVAHGEHQARLAQGADDPLPKGKRLATGQATSRPRRGRRLARAQVPGQRVGELSLEDTGGKAKEMDVETGRISPEAAVLQHAGAMVFVKQWCSIVFAPLVVWISLGQGSTTRWTIVCCWMLSSVAMQVANKFAAVSFQASALLVIIQMLIADALILMTQYRLLKYKDWRDLVRWSVVPFLVSGLLVSSIYAYKVTTMSTVLILRNFLPLVTFTGEKMLLGVPRVVQLPLVMSMFLTLVGTIMYGYQDASVTWTACAFIVINCIFTVADRLTERILIGNPDFSVSLPLCILMDNTLGILPMIGLACSTGEIFMWPTVVMEAPHNAWFWVIVSGIIGCCYGFQGLQVQKMVSATSVLMMQNFGKIVVVFLDICLNQAMDFASFVGCVISIVGAFFYGSQQITSRVFEEESHKDSKKAMPPSSKAGAVGKMEKGDSPTSAASEIDE